MPDHTLKKYEGGADVTNEGKTTIMVPIPLPISNFNPRTFIVTDFVGNLIFDLNFIYFCVNASRNC